MPDEGWHRRHGSQRQREVDDDVEAANESVVDVLHAVGGEHGDTVAASGFAAAWSGAVSTSPLTGDRILSRKSLKSLMAFSLVLQHLSCAEVLSSLDQPADHLE